jgi:hypothetical protein
MSGRSGRSPAGAFFAGMLTLGMAGCRSAFVVTTIDNQGSTAVRLVEVDYPSASFGFDRLGPHSQFHYRFKIQGSGPLKIEFTDADGKLHNSNGPTLNQGQEGTLGIVIQPSGEVGWQPSLTSPQ